MLVETTRNNGCGDPGCNVLMIVKGLIEQIEIRQKTAMDSINGQLKIHIEYLKELSNNESDRIKEVRRVDTEAVAIANERAVKQAEVLATQVAASAEALRILVAQTAATIAQQLALVTAQLIERIAALEKAQYENAGKTGASPDLQKLVTSLVNDQSFVKGKSGISTQIMFVLVGVACTILTAMIFLVFKL